MERVKIQQFLKWNCGNFCICWW